MSAPNPLILYYGVYERARSTSSNGNARENDDNLVPSLLRLLGSERKSFLLNSIILSLSLLLPFFSFSLALAWQKIFHFAFLPHAKVKFP
jgi:hypothetical protein